MTDSKYKWQDTSLWNQLNRRNDSESVKLKKFSLESGLFDNAEKILDEQVAIVDLTLHNSQHAFRVAENMISVIPARHLETLNSYEILLLLLSAYIHDIGMVPKPNLISDLKDEIRGSDKRLDPNERRSLQEWIDENTKLNIDLDSDHTDNLPDRLVKQYVSVYTHLRHIEWGKLWIDDFFSHQQSPNPKLRSNLKWLCQSHNEGKDFLISQESNAMQTDLNKNPTNLKYLACVLRIADIIEVSPKRAPAALLHHRQIHIASEPYWEAENCREVNFVEISSTLRRLEITFSKPPTNQIVLNLIDNQSNAIKQELELCRELLVGSKNGWDLDSVIDCKPPEGLPFIPIDAKFRINPDKILGILSDTSFYGDPKMAIRELLQNAFDSVKISIAEEYINKNKHTDVALEEIRSKHCVKLCLLEEQGNLILVCEDTGIGMSKEEITNRFLTSRNKRSHKLLEIERQFQKLGHELNTAGEFGIGIYSYYLIAESIEFETNPFSHSESDEHHGFSFSIGQINDYGELRNNINRTQRGTKVTLKLLHEIQGSIKSEKDFFESFFQQHLCFLPCKFKFEDQLNDSTFQLNDTWTKKDSWLKSAASSGFRSEKEKPSENEVRLAKSSHYEYHKNEIHWKSLNQNIQSALSFNSIEGEIKGVCTYRCHFPFFNHSGAKALVHTIISKDDHHLVLEPFEADRYIFIPTFQLIHSWKGFRINVEGLERYSDPWILEIDWRNLPENILARNKNTLIFTERHKKHYGQILREVNDKFLEFFEEIRQSSFDMLNFCIVSPVGTHMPTTPFWPTLDNKSKKVFFERVKFPAIMESSAYRNGSVEWKSNPVTIMANLKTLTHNHSAYNQLSCARALSDPSRIVFAERTNDFLSDYANFSVVPLWEKASSVVNNRRLVKTKFPEQWVDVASVRIRSYYSGREDELIWNQDHPLSEVDLNSVNDLSEDFEVNLDVHHDYKEKILSNTACAMAWLYLILVHSEYYTKIDESWNALAEHDREFLEKVWKKSQVNTDSLCIWDTSINKLAVLKTSSWTTYYLQSDLDQIIPLPDDQQWWLK